MVMIICIILNIYERKAPSTPNHKSKDHNDDYPGNEDEQDDDDDDDDNDNDGDDDDDDDDFAGLGERGGV